MATLPPHAPNNSLKPFADGSSALTAGGLSAENHPDRLVVFGEADFTITRDARGLQLARTLAPLIADALKVLEADHAAGRLPEVIEDTPAAPTDEIKNPL